MEILVGCDPEIFVLNKAGVPVSAHGMVPGTKVNPHRVAGGSVQVDGMALEIGIDPAKTQEDFYLSINQVMEHLKTMLPEGHELHLAATARFSIEEMEAAPAEAKMLGCEPDYDAYSKRANPRPKDPGSMRTAAGHVHVGWGSGMGGDVEHIAECVMLAKELDHRLGIPSVLWDMDYKRRKVYGKAGAYRPKPYGMEYRVLSNFWLRDRAYIEWVYKTVITAVEDLQRGYEQETQHPERARMIINYNRTEDAERWCRDKGIRNPTKKEEPSIWHSGSSTTSNRLNYTSRIV
jgi:hypothetical protein